MPRILLPLFALLIVFATPAVSADFKKGMDAAQKGDFATALKEWKPLADQGDVRAQYNLGWMYNNGRGVPQDHKTAFKFYTLAAEQGFASAQYNLGVMYLDGRGVPQNNETAIKWFKLAADQRHALVSNGNPTDVRLGSKADIDCSLRLCLLSGVERTPALRGRGWPISRAFPI